MSKLNWIYDGNGEWTALTDVMDPIMADEPREHWCDEWCLAWHIGINEDGYFCINDSDRELMQVCSSHCTRYFKTLDLAKAGIDRLHSDVLQLEEFDDGEPVVRMIKEGA